ncbi:MAG: AAA family ATPase [Clostridiales bacterium]|nr:AAA family ATPase [Clostridiales bacterium]
MDAVILVGVQASGKSEFCKQRFYKTHIIINLDMLKTRNRERIMLEACIKAKQSFVVDNTNSTAKDREKYIMAAKPEGYRVIGYYFKTNLKDALARNSKRGGTLPASAIAMTSKKLETPTYSEGFDELLEVRVLDGFEFEVIKLS